MRSERDADEAVRRGHPTGSNALRTFYEERVRSTAGESDETRWQLNRIEAKTEAGPVRILDVGCGDGRVTALTALAAARTWVAGIDVAWDPVFTARRRGVAVVQGGIDGVALPFASERFEIVVANQVIEHMVDTDGLVLELRRVLRPGGLLLLTTPNLAAWFNRVLLIAGRQPMFSEVSALGIYGRPGTQVVGHLRVFTHKALREFLIDRGFTNVVVTGGTYADVPKPLRWMDKLLSRAPSLAPNLMVSAVSPNSEAGFR